MLDQVKALKKHDSRLSGIGIYHFIRDSLLWGWIFMLLAVILYLVSSPDNASLSILIVLGFVTGTLLGAMMSLPRLDEGWT